jgi:hypothetical protein
MNRVKVSYLNGLTRTMYTNHNSVSHFTVRDEGVAAVAILGEVAPGTRISKADVIA